MNNKQGSGWGGNLANRPYGLNKNKNNSLYKNLTNKSSVNNQKPNFTGKKKSGMNPLLIFIIILLILGITYGILYLLDSKGIIKLNSRIFPKKKDENENGMK